MEIHPYRREPFSKVGRGKFLKSFRKSLPPLRGKNDRPGDDGRLRSVYLLVFLLGVIDLASTFRVILVI